MCMIINDLPIIVKITLGVYYIKMSTKEGKLIHSLAHTKWNCKYHIAFVLKYRRKVLRRKKNDDKVNIVYNIKMERCRNY